LYPVSSFLTIDSSYGKFIVNRHCDQQIEALAKTGIPHIQSELDYILRIAETLSHEAVLVDAGANIGLVSIPLAQTLKSTGATIYCYEVQRMMHYALCGSIALNNLENIYAFNYGLGAKEEFLKMPKQDYDKPQDFGMVSLVEDKPGDFEFVEIKTIDKLEFHRLDFLKIDVEGMDVAVIQGAKDTIAKHNPWCWVEYWKCGVDEIKKEFDGLNYKFFKMDSLNLLCAPVDKYISSKIQLNQTEV
jgi:FkbM family methyltransferase